MRLKIIILISIIFLSFAQSSLAINTPENFDDAKTIVINIIQKIPTEINELWTQNVIPVWRGLAQKTSDIVNPIIKSVLEKLDFIVKERKPIIEKEFEKEKQELKQEIEHEIENQLPKVKKSILERLRELLKEEEVEA